MVDAATEQVCATEIEALTSGGLANRVCVSWLPETGIAATG